VIKHVLISLMLSLLVGCGQSNQSSGESGGSQPLFTHTPAAIKTLDLIDEADLAIRNEMDRGYAYIDEGDYDEAIQYFTSAEDMFLLENPNFIPWIGKAEALCRGGRREKGNYYLANFRCALEISSGRRGCDEIEAEPGKLHPDMQELSLCHQSFCAAEIIRPQYEGASNDGAISYGEVDLINLTREIEDVCASDERSFNASAKAVGGRR